MNKMHGINPWIIIVSLILSLGLSIWALIIANVNLSGLVFDSEKVLDFAGLLFTIVGVVFTLFFVVVGIDAFKIKREMECHVKEIEEKKAQIDSYLKKIECDNLDEMYGQIYNLTQSVTKKNVRKSLIRSVEHSRARLAAESVYLKKETRKRRIPTLVEFGDLSDIDRLSKLINDPYEEKDVIELAKEIREQLLKRLQSDAGNVNNS